MKKERADRERKAILAKQFNINYEAKSYQDLMKTPVKTNNNETYTNNQSSQEDKSTEKSMNLRRKIPPNAY